eukprot:829246-Alexandrium_andersonii.AAC.1
MSASLVGSEMCIRDSLRTRRELAQARIVTLARCIAGQRRASSRRWGQLPVSYTHLTLPTICSA